MAAPVDPVDSAATSTVAAEQAFRALIQAAEMARDRLYQASLDRWADDLDAALDAAKGTLND